MQERIVLTVTANGCTSAAASVNAVVNLLPSAPIVSTNIHICTAVQLILWQVHMQERLIHGQDQMDLFLHCKIQQ
jgi:hypothetical protein